MIYLDAKVNLFIIFASIGLVVVIFLAFLLYYLNVYKKKHLDRVVYVTLSRIAKYNDYLLLNKYFIDFGDQNVGKIDHVLITNKFICLINDFNISGVITGAYNDEQLYSYDKSGEKFILNPLTYNRNIMKKVALRNQLDNSFLKGIVVINDDSHYDIKDIPPQFYICKRKELKTLIAKIEGADVKPFKEKTTEEFIQLLDRLNLKGVKENDL